MPIVGLDLVMESEKSGQQSNGHVHIQERDRVLRKPSSSLAVRLLPYASALSILTSVIYLAYRVSFLFALGGTSAMWLAFLVEGMASFPAISTQLGVLLSTAQAEGDRMPQSLDREQRPRVDVFITHCGEGHEIVLNTAKAACVLDWPSEAYRVVVLDDSGSMELSQKVQRLSKEVAPCLMYASRGGHIQTFSKAANLNFGLCMVEDLPDGKAEFVAVLDVDMIPEPNWLEKILPHVLNNHKAGLACPPQRYYNLPAGDPLGILTDDLPGECMMRLQDYTDSSFCTGSGFVARRCALDAIGGIPEEALQEDDLTSHKLLAAGWRSVYVSVPVQWGLGPDTFAGYLTQSKRWTVGIIHVNSLMWTDWAQKLPWTERLLFILWGVVIGSTACIWTVLFIILPFLAALGDQLIQVEGRKGLVVLMRLSLVNFIAQSLYHACMSAFLDFRMPIHTLFGAIWTQPWKLMMILRYFVSPWLLTHNVPKFEPTGLAVHGRSEMVARAERSRLKMCRVVFWDCAAHFHLVVFCICLVGLSRFGVAVVLAFKDTSQLAATRFLSGIAWPPIFLLWLALSQSASIPLAYVINLLPVMSKEIVLVRNSSNGVDYASPQARATLMKKPRQLAFLSKALYFLIFTLLIELS